MNARHFSSRNLFALVCVGALASTATGDEAPERNLTERGALTWRTVNDGVMGGRSRGGFEFDASGMLIFRGATSLENNGGFSSIRSRPQRLEFDGYDGIALRVRGDGRSYKLALRVARTSRMLSYWADFDTIPETWQELRIPFSAWIPTSFGRKLRGPRLRVGNIDSVGFMLYDKKAGPFRLEVASLRPYREGDQPTSAGPRRLLLNSDKACGE
jgi:NADH dehydrogenase [ubiquinone] 1 alpha subcomplex assembly factor 1